MRYEQCDVNDQQRNGIIADPGTPAFDDFPWHNRIDPLDASRNTVIEPRDALLVINDLNANGSRRLPLTPKTLDRWLIDTTGDGFVAPGDAVLVINYLNELARRQLAGEGEGPRFVFPAQADLLPATPISSPPRTSATSRQLTPAEDYYKRYPGTAPDLKSAAAPRSYTEIELEEDWDGDLLELLVIDQSS